MHDEDGRAAWTASSGARPGATVTAIRAAVYFPDYQHAQPFVVLAAWAAALFAAMLVAARRLVRGSERG